MKWNDHAAVAATAMALRSEISETLRPMSQQRLELVAKFISQILVIEDPDVVDTFLAWRADPRVDSLLHIAGRLDDESLDQLLFAAEDISINLMPSSLE